MRSEHLSIHEIERLRRGALTPKEIIDVAHHLATCGACAELAQRQASFDRCAELLAGDDEHPNVETDLVAYVDGTLTPERSAAIASHIDSCARCSEDVADLSEERDRLMRRRWGWRAAFAATMAAAAAAAFVVVLITPRKDRDQKRPSVAHPIAAASTISTSSYGRADWDALVHDALQSGHIAAPRVLADVRPSADRLRGLLDPSSATLAPQGIVIEETQPRMTWSAVRGARYVVSIFDGEREVASSPAIETTFWSPAKPLRRGVTYTWQVEVPRRGKESSIIPAPPNPLAMFRVLDARSANEIADAQQRFPNDHLLLGVLAARAGLQQRARDELQQVGSPEAQRLADDIRRWQ